MIYNSIQTWAAVTFNNDVMTISKLPNGEPEEETASGDIREVLLDDLASQFTTELERDDMLPDVAREALLDLLDSEELVASDVIKALSKNDSPESEAGHE